MTTVYIDVLFFVNLIVNMMLYASACMIRRKNMIWWRILCAAAVGAVYSCAVFLSGISSVIYNAAAIVLYLLCAWLVLGGYNLRDYIKNALATMFCAFVFAGIFYFIYRYADVGSFVVFNNNVLYIDIPVFALLCISGVCFGVISLVSRAFVHVIGAGTEYTVTVQFFERKITMKAKIDTGNTMADAISGSPVLLASRRQIIKLLPENFNVFMDCGDVTLIEPRYQSRLRMVMCKTATGEGVLPAFRPDFLCLIYNGKKMRIHNILIAVSKTDLDEVGLLLSPLMFKEAETCEALD